MSECIVKIPVFEGPLDLLLHLVRKNKLDIFDLPISLITRQYLAYLEMMKALDLDIAAEYLAVAATLLYIKSKLLLPAEEETASQEEVEDPREELVSSLVELAKFQKAAEELAARPLLERDVFVPPGEEPSPHEGLSVSLFELLSVLREVLSRRPLTPLEVKKARELVGEKIPAILSLLREKKKLYFSELLMRSSSREEAIAYFLALLELAFRGRLYLIQPGPEAEIEILAR